MTETQQNGNKTLANTITVFSAFHSSVLAAAGAAIPPVKYAKLAKESLKWLGIGTDGVLGLASGGLNGSPANGVAAAGVGVVTGYAAGAIAPVSRDHRHDFPVTDEPPFPISVLS